MSKFENKLAEITFECFRRTRTESCISSALQQIFLSTPPGALVVVNSAIHYFVFATGILTKNKQPVIQQAVL